MVKQRSTPIEKAARLLDLVPYISTHQGISLKSLASEFNVSVEEMLEDLNTLWMCGLPGYTPLELIDLSFESGYVSIRNAEVLQRVRLLSKEELVVIAIGLDYLKESIPSERHDLSDAITSLQGRVKELIGQVASADPMVNSSHRANVLKAINTRRDLEIEYLSAIRDQITLRRITPIELGQTRGIETCYAYCHSANGFRTFRLDNIRSARISDTSTSVSKTHLTEEIKTSATFKITKRHRSTLERFLLDPANEKNLNTEQYSVSSFSVEWLLRNFLATLSSAELIAPADLAQAVGERSAKILELYENPAFSA